MFWQRAISKRAFVTATKIMARGTQRGKAYLLRSIPTTYFCVHSCFITMVCISRPIMHATCPAHHFWFLLLLLRHLGIRILDLSEFRINFWNDESYTQLVGCLRLAIGPLQGLYLHTISRTHKNVGAHPCPVRGSNPWSHCSSSCTASRTCPQSLKTVAHPSRLSRTTGFSILQYSGSV